MTNEELEKFTGLKTALFERHGRACVALIGVETKAMENIFGNYENMQSSNQREMKQEVMKYWVENVNRLEKKKICRDLKNIFPSTLKAIEKQFKKP